MNRANIKISALSLFLTISAATFAGPAKAEPQSSAAATAQTYQFSLPEETTACAADDDATAFSYGTAKLGMSFKKWKEVQQEKGVANSITKVSHDTDPKAASYKVSGPSMEIWGESWNPLFLFSNDQGVYRLTMIQGNFPKKIANAVLERIEKEKGKPEEDPATQSIVWTTEDGKTRTLITHDDSGGINVGIYDRALSGRWMREVMKDIKDKH